MSLGGIRKLLVKLEKRIALSKAKRKLRVKREKEKEKEKWPRE